MGEGFYRPHEIDLPAAVRAALPAVVRVYTRIQLWVHVYPTPEQTQEARQRPGAYQTQYRPEGGVIWPSHLSSTDLLALRNDPLARIQAGRFELVEATRHLDPPDLREPAQVLTRTLGSGATGFILGFRGDRAVIATNYHLAREAIGRHARQDGVYDWQPVPTRDVRIGTNLVPENLTYDHVLEEVELVCNASFDDWQGGNDWALLTVPAASLPVARGLPLAARPSAGEEVWGLGFPARSARPEKTGYADADGTLRVTHGVLLGTETGGAGWRAELDGLSGSSGSPVMNAQGEVVGLLRNHTHYHFPDTGPIDRRFMEYGGQAQLAPTDTIQKIIAEAGLTLHRS